MKCDFCPFAPPSGEYGQDECELFDQYGTEWKDGRCGCTLSYSHLKKIDEERSEYYFWMGTEMGMEGDFEHYGLSMEKAIRQCKHMLGMGIRKPYTRHGKKFYRPYRNYYCGFSPELDYMSKDILVEKEEPKKEGGHPYYHLTRRGREWLGRQIGITIRDPED